MCFCLNLYDWIETSDLSQANTHCWILRAWWNSLWLFLLILEKRLIKWIWKFYWNVYIPSEFMVTIWSGLIFFYCQISSSCIKCCFSFPFNVMCVVLQGSVLGPLFNLVCIGSIRFYLLEGLLEAFADDTALTVSSRSTDSLYWKQIGSQSLFLYLQVWAFCQWTLIKLILGFIGEVVSLHALIKIYFLTVGLCHRCIKCVIWDSSLIVIYLGRTIVSLLQLKLLEVWEFCVD